MRCPSGSSGPGKYQRTEESRAKSRANARPCQPCKDHCTCARHYPNPGRGSKKCLSGCICLRHRRTLEHNNRIGMSVKLTSEAKKRARK